MTKEVNFSRITNGFEVNINALKVFNNQIGKLAEEHDKKIVDQQNSEMAQLLGISVEDFPKLEGITKDDIQAVLSPESEAINKNGNDNSVELRQVNDEARAVIQKMASIADNEDFLIKSVQVFKSSMKSMPIQALILRRSALITLASHFEFLISELIHSYYSLYPQALPSEERVLSLADLRELGSIEEAENQLITKEIDALLRDNLERQLDYFTKRSKINLDALNTYKNKLVEIFQRRNIFVHNNGVVNKIYLSRVDPNLVEYGVEEGSRLNVTEEYLNNAIESVFLSGMILIQLCWRKWQNSNRSQADSIYIELLYESLRTHQYAIVNALRDFSPKLDFTSDRNKRVVITNHAIALRELNQIDEMEKVISLLDWSSCSLEFRAALVALRGDEKSLLKILPKAIAAKEISKYNLESWPLFLPFRTSKDFINLIETSSNENIFSDQDPK